MCFNLKKKAFFSGNYNFEVKSHETESKNEPSSNFYFRKHSGVYTLGGVGVIYLLVLISKGLEFFWFKIILLC